MKIPHLSFAIVIFCALIFSQGSCRHGETDSRPVIESIEINVPSLQRARKSFTIVNVSPVAASWRWELIDSETGKVTRRSDAESPSFSLPEGTYDVVVTASARNTLQRHFRRMLTVLPPVFSEKEADEVIDLSQAKKSTFVRDFGNKKRPGYKIIIKGSYTGRLKITGLRGTARRPVHIINQGQVEITAGNDRFPYALSFSDNNQYILLDGKADPSVPYGFRVKGHPSKSGQVVFFAGVFNRGIELCGFHISGNQGKTHGAAGIQVQTTYTEDCNASNWSLEYFRFHHNKIENASSEGMYIGYFTDDVRDNGKVPFRLGQVRIYRDTIVNSGWDGIQIASADDFEVHDNYIDGASLSGKRSHSSLVAWNNGNANGWVYRNTMKNAVHAFNIFFGNTGQNAYIYSNLLVEGSYPSTVNTPAFIYSKISNAHNDVGLYIFHNTILTSRISAKIEYRKENPAAPIPVLYAANAIVQNRLNLRRYPEIAMGRDLADSLSWTINNVWRMSENAHEIEWDEDLRPVKGSPLLRTRFDITEHIPKLKGGFYDRNGYPLRHEEFGFAAGCYSPHQISQGKMLANDGTH